MQLKQRMTVSVDPEIVRAGNEAVASGRASSLSAWVSAALTERVAHERRLIAMAEAIAKYEAEFGVITEEEMAAQLAADERDAVVVNGGRQGRDPR